MVLPQPFTTSSPIITSYDYTDIADGTGVIKFQGSKTETSAGVDYILSRETLSSSYLETSSADEALDGSQVSRLIQSVDFDLTTFNIPKSAKGTAYIETSFNITKVSGTDTAKGYMIYTLKNVPEVGSTVEIASVQTIERNTNASSSQRVSLPMTIPLTHFKRGDTLRLTIEGWARAGGGTGCVGKTTIPHDPSNSQGTVIVTATFQGETFTTKLDMHIPFLLEV